MKQKRFLFPALMFALLGGCSMFFETGHPKDEKLIENFQSHKAEFNQLLEMFLADKDLKRVAQDFTRPEDPQTVGVSLDRISQYRELFRRLNLSAGIEGYKEKDEVWFLASSIGLSISGSKKGYAYFKERPELVVENLDNYWSKDGKSFTAFRHIEGNWYLYFDYED